MRDNEPLSQRYKGDAAVAAGAAVGDTTTAKRELDEAAAAKGVGFNDADARTLVLATLKGATALAEASDESPAVLRERVTSKGGTTAAALAVINERGVQQALVDAVQAARDRGAELGAMADE